MSYTMHNKKANNYSGMSMCLQFFFVKVVVLALGLAWTLELHTIVIVLC